MSEPLLRVEHLGIEFFDHGYGEEVVRDVSFTLGKGEILGIVGESGSGKSMTSMAIAGLLKRHDVDLTGKILFEEQDLLKKERAEMRKLQGNDISIIFQEPMTSLNPVKKIGWQVEESLKIHHPQLSREERYQRAIRSLSSVELDEPEKIYKKYPHELSGGMRQRVMIASAMICEPKLLIADEPTTALDVTIQLQIVKLLQKLNKENHTSILFISHDLSLVKKLCDRILVMNQGKLVETGSSDDIFYHPKDAYTKQLIDAIPKLEKIVL